MKPAQHVRMRQLKDFHTEETPHVSLVVVYKVKMETISKKNAQIIAIKDVMILKQHGLMKMVSLTNKHIVDVQLSKLKRKIVINKFVEMVSVMLFVKTHVMLMIMSKTVTVIHLVKFQTCNKI